MSYIGREPAIGNYQVCDALTASATATYALAVGGTSVSPESANHVICSLNGIIQKPVSSFTISGSNIVFASALTSSDSIDFIMLLGSTLDVGIPSDASITNAKLAQDIISGETELASAPADTDEFLVSDAGTLKRIDYSLIKSSSTPSFLATISGAINPSNDTNTDAAFNSEVYDNGGCYNNTSGTVTLNSISTPAYSFAPNEAGKYLIFAVIRFGSDSSRPAFDQAQMRLRKNSGDSANQILSTYGDYSIDAFNLPLTTIVEANGSSDTFKVDYYLSVETGTITVYAGQHQSYWGAFKLTGV